MAAEVCSEPAFVSVYLPVGDSVVADLPVVSTVAHFAVFVEVEAEEAGVEAEHFLGLADSSPGSDRRSGIDTEHEEVAPELPELKAQPMLLRYTAREVNPEGH